jgi:hypothetical protein
MSSKAPWALMLWLAAAGCGAGDGASEVEAPPQTTSPASGTGTPPEHPPAPPATGAEPAPLPSRPSALDTATACERARACCPLFVEAIGDPVEAERARIACEQMEHLGELGEASGEACLAALDGWARALELAEREVPLSCR